MSRLVKGAAVLVVVALALLIALDELPETVLPAAAKAVIRRSIWKALALAGVLLLALGTVAALPWWGLALAGLGLFAVGGGYDAMSAVTGWDPLAFLRGGSAGGDGPCEPGVNPDGSVRLCLEY